MGERSKKMRGTIRVLRSGRLAPVGKAYNPETLGFRFVERAGSVGLERFIAESGMRR